MKKLLLSCLVLMLTACESVQPYVNAYLDDLNQKLQQGTATQQTVSLLNSPYFIQEKTQADVNRLLDKARPEEVSYSDWRGVKPVLSRLIGSLACNASYQDLKQETHIDFKEFADGKYGKQETTPILSLLFPQKTHHNDWWNGNKTNAEEAVQKYCYQVSQIQITGFSGDYATVYFENDEGEILKHTVELRLIPETNRWMYVRY